MDFGLNQQQDFIFDWEILIQADLTLADNTKVNAQFTKVYLDDTNKWTFELDSKMTEMRVAESPTASSDRSELEEQPSYYTLDRSEATKSSEEEVFDPDAEAKVAMGLPASFGGAVKHVGKLAKTSTKKKRKDLDFTSYWKLYGKMFENGVEELAQLEPNADIHNTTFAKALNAITCNKTASLLREHRSIEYFHNFVKKELESHEGKGDGQCIKSINDLIRRDVVNTELIRARNRSETFAKKLHQFSYISGFKYNKKGKEKETTSERSSAKEILSPFTDVKYDLYDPVYFGNIKRKNYSLRNDDIDLDAPVEVEEDVTASVPAKEEDDPKNFDFSFDPVRDAQLVAKNALSIFGNNKTLLKYWHQRHRLFSKLNDGILMDVEGWFSVTPEEIAIHIADRMVTHKNCIILDAFTGVGGNAIQFALRGALVYAIDLDPVKIRCARQNAKVYGVADRITFICGNFYHIAKSLCGSRSKEGLLIDSIFLSPPWGGPEYLNNTVFELGSCVPDGFDIFKVAHRISPNIAYFLPRNTSSNQLMQLSGDTPSRRVEIEHNVLNNKIKALTAYYGNLANSTKY